MQDKKGSRRHRKIRKSRIDSQVTGKSKRYQFTVVCAGVLEKECLVRVFEVWAKGERDARELSRVLLNRLDQRDMGAISEEISPVDEGFDNLEILAVRETRSSSTTHAWTRDEIESDNFEKFIRIVPPSSLVGWAHHEAGHAFVGHRMGLQITEVFVSDQAAPDGTLGECLVTFNGYEDPGDLLLFALAGLVSEAKFLAAKFTVAGMLLDGPRYLGGHSDFQQAAKLSRQIHGLSSSADSRFIEDHIIVFVYQSEMPVNRGC